MKNLELWDSVQKTDPKYAKDFKGAGGFSGTAVNPTWLAKRATEVFGPIGLGWGIEPIHEEFVEGHPFIAENGAVLGYAKIHKVKGRLWYLYDGQKGEVVQYGQTEFVGRNKYGLFTDGDVAKKSLTDAMSKCLSLLGFSSDIYLQVFDGSKYIDTPKEEPVANTKDREAQYDLINDINGICNLEELEVYWADNEEFAKSLPGEYSAIIIDQYASRTEQLKRGETAPGTYKFLNVSKMDAWMERGETEIKRCTAVHELTQWQNDNRRIVNALETRRKKTFVETFQKYMEKLSTQIPPETIRQAG